FLQEAKTEAQILIFIIQTWAKENSDEAAEAQKWITELKQAMATDNASLIHQAMSTYQVLFDVGRAVAPARRLIATMKAWAQKNAPHANKVNQWCKFMEEAVKTRKTATIDTNVATYQNLFDEFIKNPQPATAAAAGTAAAPAKKDPKAEFKAEGEKLIA